VVVQDEPEREGIRLATPVDALTRLRRYIKDALNPDHDKRVFPSNNKRFMEAYGLHGRDCRDLLQRLGFRYNVREAVHHTDISGVDRLQEEETSWTLPSPPFIEDRLGADGSNLRELLEDWEMELLALAWRTADEMNIVNPVAGEGWSPAQRDLERVLGTQGCKSPAFHVLDLVAVTSLGLAFVDDSIVLCLCCSEDATNGSLQI
jgi:ubiquitin carboxyl-terminal hydrolase 25/28